MIYDETEHWKYHHKAEKMVQICLSLHLIEKPTFPLSAIKAIKCQHEQFIIDTSGLCLCKGDLQPCLLKC